jgi:predicted glycoside hydrolase/deacetylase ChbG (UPF0249 family)
MAPGRQPPRLLARLSSLTTSWPDCSSVEACWGSACCGFRWCVARWSSYAAKCTHDPLSDLQQPITHMPSQAIPPTRLIVNADDYGYFHCVSRGILDAARQGIVTATGVLATSPSLNQHLGWLRSCPNVDSGVHLNLTSGWPISTAMKRRLRWSGGQFPRKGVLVALLLTAAVTRSDIREEWRCQIDRCLALGLNVMFLNSHEHVHMIPPLFSLIHELAKDYAIEHVRFPVGEIWRRRPPSVVSRGVIINALALCNRWYRVDSTIPCLGVADSGRLSIGYLRQLLPTLRSGHVYELMCHPG